MSSGGTSVPDPRMVVIGGSAGGMRALAGILTTFASARGTAVCVVLHRAPNHSPLAEVLQTYTDLPVHEPDSSPFDCPLGAITVAPAGYHLLLGNTRTLSQAPSAAVAPYETGPGVRAHLTLDAPVAHSRPSLDVTFESAAGLVNPPIAVLLSCANDDGAAGCAAVRAAGGKVALQDPATCEAPTAVRAALRSVEPDYLGDPQGIGTWLSRMLP